MLRGGGGLDTVTYADRTAPLTVTIGDGEPDGEDGEGDDVQADVEIVRGGRGNDTLTGTTADEELYGGPATTS